MHAPSGILLIGALGQIGSELVQRLRAKYGRDNVIGADIRKPSEDVLAKGPFEIIDVTNKESIDAVVVKYGLQGGWVICNAALLSGAAEKNHLLALKVNMDGVTNVLEVARSHKLRVLVPSTIGAFGPTSPKVDVPDVTIQRPTTIYGITKVYTEHIGEYYAAKFGVDFRSLRYPGIISWSTPPGFGTTDWLIDIFHGAVKSNSYKCFLTADRALPMMYMEDCLTETIKLLEAEPETLTQKTYNVNGVTLSPRMAAELMQAVSPGFTIEYDADFRDEVAAGWPESLDDAKAREDWGLEIKYGGPELVQEMYARIKELLANKE